MFALFDRVRLARFTAESKLGTRFSLCIQERSSARASDCARSFRTAATAAAEETMQTRLVTFRTLSKVRRKKFPYRFRRRAYEKP